MWNGKLTLACDNVRQPRWKIYNYGSVVRDMMESDRADIGLLEGKAAITIIMLFASRKI